VKVDKKDRSEIVEAEPTKKRIPYGKKQQEVISVTEEETSIVPIATEKVLEEVGEGTDESVEVNDTPEQESESTEKVTKKVASEDPSNEYKVREAQKAEKSALIALSLFIASFITLLIPFTVPLSVVLFIIGSVYMSNSNKSMYITPKGERHAHSARIMQIIYFVLILLIIAAILFVLFIVL
jgi:hypothetical protein